MIAHIIIGTAAATLTASGSAICGGSIGEVLLCYLVGGFVGIALSISSTVLGTSKPVPGAC